MKNNKILLLKPTDQRYHKLNKYIDLHCNYDFDNWVEGFKQLGKDLIVYDFMRDYAEYGTQYVQDQIIKIVKDEIPEYTIWPSMTYEILGSTFDKIRKFGTKIIAFFFDDEMRFNNYSKYFIGNVDYVITCDSKKSEQLYKNLGINAQFVTNNPSFSFYENKKIQEKVYDVSFVGNKIADREKYLNKISNANIDVNVFGMGWNSGIISTKDMINIFNETKINLSFMKSEDMKSFQLKGRIFEICMCGGFLLSEYVPGIENFYEIGKEIECFSSDNELISKIEFYLNNEEKRQQIAEASYLKTKKNYSFEKIMSDYFDKLKVIESSNNSIGESNNELVKNSLISSAFSRFKIGRIDQFLDELKCAGEIDGNDKNILRLQNEMISCMNKIEKTMTNRSLFHRIKYRLFRN